jgi:hypothetical protein
MSRQLKDGDFVVEVEIGIGGYRQSLQTFSGTQRAIGTQIKAYVDASRVRMHESGELHGDLREFAPKMGGHYVMYNDYDDVEVCYTSVRVVQLKQIELNYNHEDWHNIQDYLNTKLGIEDN